MVACTVCKVETGGGYERGGFLMCHHCAMDDALEELGEMDGAILLERVDGSTHVIVSVGELRQVRDGLDAGKATLATARSAPTPHKRGARVPQHEPGPMRD